MTTTTEHTATPVDQDRMTRAERAALPLTTDVAQAVAEQHGLCVRPLAMRRIELGTGRVDVVPVPCGSTRDDQCRPCADKARRLRMAQCREGWHLEDEPVIDRRLCGRAGCRTAGARGAGPVDAVGSAAEGKAHKPEHLGIGGRRVLVSRKWSNKTLDDHRAERAAFVRQLLTQAGIQPSHGTQDGPYLWERTAPADPDVPPRPLLLLHAVAERQR